MNNKIKPKFIALFLMGLSLCMSSSSHASDTPPPSQAEINTLLGKINASKAALAQLMTQRDQTIQKIKGHLGFTKSGLKLIEDYETLIRTRYLDDEGDFDPSLPISGIDLTNIQKLIKAYLNTDPSQNNLSARKALDLLSISYKKLKTKAKVQSDPSEDNSSEVQILEQKIAETQDGLDEQLDSAKKLGIKI